MKKGLVLGKFMPLHKGHIALIDFALKHCDQVTVLLCYHQLEEIAGTQRAEWLRQLYGDNPAIDLLSYEYDPAELTETSEPNPEYARQWAEAIGPLVPGVQLVFSSEKYGANFASHLNAEHLLFDVERTKVPVAASMIRTKPISYWSFLPDIVRPFFVKKVALVGSESTGKSTLAKLLAEHYATAFVPEMARELIGHTNECTLDHLYQIAELHARTIVDKTKEANALLFCDTDVSITKSYAVFLFGKELVLPAWIEEANRCDLYLFLDTDCPYVQDGTRLSENERKELSRAHRMQLDRSGISYKIINGSWADRFNSACKEIDEQIRRY